METSEFKFPWFDRKVWAVGGVLFLILATLFVGLRTFRNFAEPAREFNWESRGMSDFYTLYYYSKAFSDGVNPYSREIMDRPEYTVPRNAAPFSPFAFLAFLPLTFFSLSVASVIFFAANWLLLGALAWCCIRMSRIQFDWALWVWIFGFLVFSRPGHMTLFTGYFTTQLVLGTIVALHYSRSNPLVSGIGFLFAAVKPTYAIPLTILMLARRDFKATAIGVVLSSVFAIGCFAWLTSYSDFGSVIEGIKSSQEAFHDDPTEDPVNTWTRIDLAGMVAKVMHRIPGTGEYLGVMLLLLIVPCVALWRATSNDGEDDGVDHGAGGLTALIVVLAMLVSIYHHSYDCLLVAVVFISALLQAKQMMPSMPRLNSIIVGFLLAFPMVNFVSTRSGREGLGFEQSDSVWQLITMANGACLLLALLISLPFALKKKTAIHSKSNSA